MKLNSTVLSYLRLLALTLVMPFFHQSADAQCSIVNQAVTVSQSAICSGASGQVQLGSSQAGVTYKLRNDADNAVIGTALTGTGSSLSFSTGALTSNTSFNVYAEYASYGLQFDGTNDHITLNNPVNTASFTLEAWIKTSVASWTGTNAFEGSGLLYADVGGGANDYTFALINNKVTFFDGGNNINVTGTTNLNDGNWHHVAMIRTAGVKNRLYVDGVFQAEANASSVVLNARAQMVIGGNNGDNRYFNGTMDEVRVWNFAMDPAVLAANMYTCYTGTETGLRALFKFENGPNSATATNSIGSNNGTLVNTNNAAVWVSGTNICAGCNLEMTDVVSISISPLPAAPTGSASQSLCSGTTVASLSATGSNINWYAASSGGSALASTTALVNNTTYYASQTVNGCEGTSRLAVLVTLVTQPSAPGQSATGGTVTTVGGYKIHTFTTSGTFTVPAGMSGVNAEVLVVAGGGGGGFRHAGGGGAGGLVYNSSFALTAGQSYTVTVGAGGAGAPNSSTNQGVSGGNSVFGTITAIGGGGGGTNNKVGNAGGSGGGGSNGTNGGSGTAGQGNKGGNQNNGAGCCHAWGCGGGGAGAAGANTSGSAGSAGGIGLQYSISGTPTYYAGGGGGGNGSNATALLGGLGGGGNGGTNAAAATAGAPNTGGGGGGGGVSPEPGAAGGSGIVIVRYLDAGASSLNQTFCGASTVSNLSMSGTNVQWYNVATGGTALSSATSISTGTYYATQSNGTCESARTTVTVTVNMPVTYYLDADNDGYYISTTSACSSPGASYRTTGNFLGDCNDNNASVFGSAETCNGLDDDCDGSIDEGLLTLYFVDADQDGFGIGSGTSYCSNPGAGYALVGGDCNDANLSINPSATEVCNGLDDNCQNGIDDGLTFLDYYYDGDNDNYGSLNAPSPGLTGSLLTGLQYYLPMDGNFNDQSGNGTAVSNEGGVTNTSDRFGDPNKAGSFATNQRLYSTLNVSETAFAVSMFFKTTNPNAGFFAVTGGGHDRHVHLSGGNIRVRLWANEVLQSSGLNLADNQWHHVVYQYQQNVQVQKVYVDGNLVLSGTRTFSDFNWQTGVYVGYSEDTGYLNGGSLDDVAIWTRALTLSEIQNLYNGTSGSSSYPVNACQDPGNNYAPNILDCNDNSAAVNPAVAESCNAIDDDCDGTADDGLTFVNYYTDADGDGYGSGAASNLCSNPGAGYVTNNTDCNDNDASLNSITTEVCNNFDDDCDGSVDNGLTFVNYYVDNDGDGYGSGAVSNLCSNPGAGYVTNNTDCNDNDAALHSITAEVCNNFDDDCDGTADDGLTFVNYYVDADGDGYGAGAASNLCSNPGSGYVTNNTDCNDNNANLNSITTEVCNNFDDDCDGTADDGLTFVNYYTDADGDGYGAGAASNLCSNPGAGYVTNNTDCDDNDASLYSITTEVCNNFDDDCDGSVDNGLTFVNYYVDNDGDGYGSGAASNLCSNPGAGYVTNNTDCNDNDTALNAITAEVCNNFDDDCDGSVDNGLTFVNYYVDNDGDGYGAGAASNLCSNPGAGYVTNNTDCNDNDASLNSITTEVCNNFDDDCDGTADDGLTFVNYYTDADGDGYGAGAASNLCSNPGAGYVTNNTDCNDNDAALHSITAEVCNNFDDDCDGTADDGLTFVNYYTDADGDGYGAGAASNLCSNPGAGYVTNNTDCNDNNASLNSITTEVCNNFDDDCDGTADDGLTFVNYYVDNDGDGYGAGAASNLCSNPGAGYVTNNTDCNDNDAALNSITTEVCNNFDDDCDGSVDDGLTFVNYYVDTDGDGYGAGAASNLCSNPGAGYVTNNTDCNNNNATVHAITVEVCNNFDDDCDGTADDGLTFVNYYVDTDGDGYGAGAASNLCSNPGAGYVTNNTDCNNNNATVHAITVEVCNNFDDDCDGSVDDGLTFVNYYVDSDGDGYGAGAASNLCSNPGAGYVTNNTDCNNNNATVHAITVEVCNNFDDDCDGTADDGLTFVNYYVDTDGDGYGAGAASNLCSNPGAGYVTNNTDCNNNNATVHTITVEVCNNFDDDCDGTADDGLTFVNYYVDTDGDGYGAGAASNLCSNPGAGYVTNNTDCNNNNATVHAITVEVCNNFDDDCDGTADDGLTFVNYYVDTDGDGYGAGAASNLCSNPGAGYVTNNTDCNNNNATVHAITVEVCNNFDDDCDGTADDGLTFVNYYVDTDGDGYGAGAASNLCSNPGAGYVTNNTDCNNNNATVHAITVEVCNNFDDDCDGTADDGLTFINYYVDVDGDGYGAGVASNLCSNPGVGYSTNADDCDDAVSTTYPEATEACNDVDDDCNGEVDNDIVFTNYYADVDGDGFGAGDATSSCSDLGAGFVTNNTDCNDNDATLNSITEEVCNNFDDDCDGTADDGLTFINYYVDADGDGFGAGVASNLCSNPGVGYSTNSEDCDDAVSTTYPGATEACNDVDDDCNGEVDNDIVFTNYYADVDGDGFGAGDTTSSCSDLGAGYVTNNTDCNDADGNIYPTATETCNYIDDNCDGNTDEEVTTTYYEDLDADGYGNLDVTIQECGLLNGYSENGLDCNDVDGSIYPTAAEVCNTIDDNCDGEVDEFVTTTFFADNDGDGFGDVSSTIQSCNLPMGYVINAEDCDDSVITYEDLDGDGYGTATIIACGVLSSNDCDDAISTAYPGAMETCNNVDDDCNGLVDNTVVFSDYFVDADGDGYGTGDATSSCSDLGAGFVTNNVDCNDTDGNIYPTATETCNYIDDNCDGITDEGVTSTYYEDLDSDGYGNSDVTIQECGLLNGYSENGLDCDDQNETIYPTASEVCNTIDDNCDGEVDEFVTTTFYGDNDGDGFGFAESTTESCELPSGYVTNADDCDDSSILYEDLDGDGFGAATVVACGVSNSDDCDDAISTVYPGAAESCDNGVDEDCDGSDVTCIYLGCTDVVACNYNASANTDDGSCTYPVQSYLNCDGTCINDTDADGVCNEIEVAGCTDATACNYNASATDEDNTCTYPAQSYLNCDGTCINDTDADGVCNEIEVAGCTDATACNYNASATDEDNTCTYPAQFYLNCDGTCINDTDADGVCNEIEVAGCTDATACNYNASATDEDNTCTYPAQSYLNCDGTCINDTDADGVCNEIEVAGCTDATACNYNASATDEDNTCTYPAQSYLNCDGTCINDTDADGVCNEIEVAGCTDVTACNYIVNATQEDGSCTYPVESYLNCNGTCINDTDADGVCNEIEVAGCTDVTACNYNENATDDNGTCILPVAEICNLLDDDCDGETDEFVTTTYYADLDQDGFGDLTNSIQACTLPAGYTNDTSDCNDAAPTYLDQDGDGFGVNTLVACGVLFNTDCDDANATIYPGVNEQCNLIDDNCDGITDNNVVYVNYYADADADGFGNSGLSVLACVQPTGYTNNNDDCNDTDAAINPDAVEIEGNNIDENCDGQLVGATELSEWTVSIYPNPTRGIVQMTWERNEDVVIRIIDAQGKLVMSSSLNQSKSAVFNLDDVESGMYFVQWTNSVDHRTYTIIKE